MREVDHREHHDRRRHQGHQEGVPSCGQGWQREEPHHRQGDGQSREGGHALPAGHGDDRCHEQHGQEQQWAAARVVEEGAARLAVHHHDLHALADPCLGQGCARVGRHVERGAVVEPDDHVAALPVVGDDLCDRAGDEGCVVVDPRLSRRRVPGPQPRQADDGRDREDRHHHGQDPGDRRAGAAGAAVGVRSHRVRFHAEILSCAGTGRHPVPGGRGRLRPLRSQGRQGPNYPAAAVRTRPGAGWPAGWRIASSRVVRVIAT